MLDLEPGDELSLIAETARKFSLENLLPRMCEAEAERRVNEETRSLPQR